MRAALDARLLDALRDTLLVIDGADEAVVSGNAAHRRAMARDRRAAQLQPYLQQRCAALGDRIAEGLQAMLTESTFDSPAAAVEPSLCIATLASSLAGGPRGALPLVLGPPDAWRDGTLPPDAPRRAADGAMAQLRRRLEGVAVVGYRVWAVWAAGCLAEGLVEGLAADDTLSLQVPLKSWEQAVMGDTVRGFGVWID